MAVTVAVAIMCGGVGFADDVDVTPGTGTGFIFNTDYRLNLLINSTGTHSWTNDYSSWSSYTPGDNLILDGDVILTSSALYVGGIMTNDDELIFNADGKSITVTNNDGGAILTAGFGYQNDSPFAGNITLGDVTTANSGGENYGVVFANTVGGISDIVGGTVAVGDISATSSNATYGNYTIGFVAGNVGDTSATSITIGNIDINAGVGGGAGVKLADIDGADANSKAVVTVKGNITMTNDLSTSVNWLNGFEADRVGEFGSIIIEKDITITNTHTGLHSDSKGVFILNSDTSTARDIEGEIKVEDSITVTSGGAGNAMGFEGGYYKSGTPGNVSGTITLNGITVTRNSNDVEVAGGAYFYGMNVGSKSLVLKGDINVINEHGQAFGVRANSLTLLEVTNSITASAKDGTSDSYGIKTDDAAETSRIDILKNVAITGTTASIALGGDDDYVNITGGAEATPWNNGGEKFVLDGVENLTFSNGYATMVSGSKRVSDSNSTDATTTTVDNAGLTASADFFNDKGKTTINGGGLITLTAGNGATNQLIVDGGADGTWVVFEEDAVLSLGNGTGTSSSDPHLKVNNGGVVFTYGDSGVGGVILDDWTTLWDAAPMYAHIDGGELRFVDNRTDKSDEWSITPVETIVSGNGARVFIPDAETKVRIGDVTGTGQFIKTGWGTLIIGKVGSATTFDISDGVNTGGMFILGEGNVRVESGVNVTAESFNIYAGTTLNLTSIGSEITSDKGLLWNGTIKVSTDGSARQITINGADLGNSGNTAIGPGAALIFDDTSSIAGDNIFVIEGAGIENDAAFIGQLNDLIKSGGLVKIDAEFRGDTSDKICLDFTSVEYYTVADTANRLGETSNAAKVASAMDDIAAVNPEFENSLRGALNSDAAVRQFLRANLGGELMAEAQTMALWNPQTRVFSHLNSLTALENDLEYRGQLRAPGFGYRFWFDGYYLSENVSSDDVAYQYDVSRPGMMLGLDMHSDKNNTFGLVLGYGAPKVTNDIGEITADDYTLGLYARYNVGWNTTINGFVGYGIQTYKYNVAAIEEDYNGQSIYVTLELMKKYPTYRGSHIFPLVAFDYQQSWTDAFTIGGNGLVLPQDIDKGNLSKSVLRVGLNGQFSNIRTRLQYGYMVGGDEFGASNVTYRVPSSPSVSRVLTGVNVGRSFANIGLGGDLNLGAFRVFADYDFDFGERRTAHTGQIGVDVKW
ncbi:MAG: autotransporter domain-containing protein [Planctomycetaceae bacterium]|jgi:hypothetical protein|nr:autotransporter domain-containing protein [Planctomycetaceae bacterium]